jgi:hypothetical protein
MDRKAAAERRRAKVLARGGDRLASITGTLAEPSQSTGVLQAPIARDAAPCSANKVNSREPVALIVPLWASRCNRGMCGK